MVLLGVDTAQKEDNVSAAKPKQSPFKSWTPIQNDEAGAGTFPNSGPDNTASKPKAWSTWGADTAKADDNNEKQEESSVKSWSSSKSPDNKWTSGANGRNEDSNQSANNGGWDSANIGGGNERGQIQWGHGKRSFGKREHPGNSNARDSSNAGEWRNKPTVNLTATRQRLDMFTSEEQDILLEIEQIMQSIRRIMHQTGYKDGDPLPADDQSFVVDSVFTHHPDKATKMGAGIDHVMVSKHSSFQESRCFYIVSVDGRKEDFSYLKCLENFIKGKYPDRAEDFIGKYFRKNRSQNRERSSGPVVEGSGGGWKSGQSPVVEASGGGWKSGQSPVVEASGSGWNSGEASGGWNSGQSPVVEAAGGWNTGQSPVVEAAGGWNTGQSVAPEEAASGDKQ